ncbi:AMP-binding protein [Phaeovulum vinaykumarii]|uniref:Acyl-[acyl-carrier-protein]-phospholipid O-acyltransferase / long-chain-fatty-acid--[acyl-carrier-protein] ligase n=2 Tax=Phaeovulum vinaykumarii TaxID=407234 RepID=A0A1N7JUG0_9RHOB|nr:AMP-binding protein [Phaeovulum vinaykumarii]SIS52844.1 acyl-[acyl-carrier-protein]-phospholipid O-acyltransferase / long-chain-fatty-acid--[acyl-carrier-protein] ligase [Phaeovulum vinaykumarii]SOB91395.1 acyl-CoA synthetase (AMP-forming)/AMP-acid ligase II [Phaeovulum vinaykumarii]
MTVSHTPPPAWLAIAVKTWFRVRHGGAWPPPSDGPVVFVANHLSLIDAPLIALLAGRRCLVAMHAHPPQHGIAGWLWRRAGVERLDVNDPHQLRDFLHRVRAGESAIVFPEARMSRHGALMKVYPEAAKLVRSTRAPVVPVHLEGTELSVWSPEKAGQPRRWRPRVHVEIGAPRPLAAEGESQGATGNVLGDLLEETRFRALSRWSSVPAVLAETARRLGGGLRVIEDPLGNALTFRRIFIAAAALGERLRRRTDPAEIVGVLLPGVATVPAVLCALWREGRVPALLNPTLGPGPARGALGVAGIRRVLSSRAFVEQADLGPMIRRFEEDGIELIWTEDLRAEIGTGRRLLAALASLRQRRIPRETPAVVLFTSGTEGAPKAVLLSHANLLANVAQLRARTDVAPADRVLTALPLFHALGLTGGLLFPLVCGARTLIYPTPLHYKVIPELAYAHQATIIFGTDTFLAGWGRRADPHDFASVRAAIAGAEPVKPSTRTLWIDRFGVRIIEGYGATEAAPVLALNTPTCDRFGTVGQFLPGIETRLEQVPGIPGARLWVRGPNVMLGYMRADRPGVLEPLTDGWYDTGDAVSITPDGFVTLEGRIKRFAKIGGEMVSLAAVERLAAQTWPEASVAAIALPDARKGERIVLAVVGTQPRRAALQERARAEGLGELLLPAEIVALDEIPLLASGKTNYPELTRRLTEVAQAQAS